jgi:hypothetical protein
MTFSLGLGGGGGGNYIRFSPSINSWQLGKEEIELKKLVFDLDSIRTGWGLMAEGQAPQWVWDDQVGQRSVKPEGDFKRGFSVRVWLGSTRVPNFEILGWIDRPADDGADEAPAPSATRSAPPSTGSRAVPPPAAKKAAADLANMDFG